MKILKELRKATNRNADDCKKGTRNYEEIRVATDIPDKIDFKTKVIKKDKEGYYIMIQGSI